MGRPTNNTPLSPQALRTRVLLVLGLGLLAGAATLAAPRLAQPQWYHDFADQRPLLGIPHALNVLSNLPFVLVGVLGLGFVLGPAARCRLRDLGAGCTGREAGGSFREPAERWPWALFFTFIALTGLGSAYYHADPTDARLVWDRLPLAVAFMAFFAILIGERTTVRAGRALLLPLVLLGAGSVVYWRLSELHGAGDLRPYLFVQLFPLLAIPLLMLLLPARYTRSADLVAALLCYVLAKGLELLDAQVYAGGGLVSGHTLKHLVAGLGGAWILYMVVKRRPAERP
jgi:hypothetical protein